MTGPDSDTEQERQTARRTRPPRSAALAIAGVVAIALVAAIAWAVRPARSPSPTAPVPGDSARATIESAWASALAKAGVEATFPAGPVDVTAVEPLGRHQFEATFSAAEVSALVNVYRYQVEFRDAVIEVEDVAIEFPADDTVAIRGEVILDGTRYSASAEAPVTYNAKGLSSPGLTSLRVAGFTADEARRRAAGEALLAYFNLYLWDAPGLTLDSARIANGQLDVRGVAPDSLVNPTPLPTTNREAW